MPESLAGASVRFLVLLARGDDLGVSITADPDVMLYFVSEASDNGDRCTIIPFDVRSVSDPDGLFSDIVEGSRVV